MEISKFANDQTMQLQRTLNINVLQSQLNAQAAQAIVMLDGLAESQVSQGQGSEQVQAAPHPTSGSVIDLKL